MCGPYSHSEISEAINILINQKNFNYSIEQLAIANEEFTMIMVDKKKESAAAITVKTTLPQIEIVVNCGSCIMTARLRFLEDGKSHPLKLIMQYVHAMSFMVMED